ncbi:MAG: protein kinase [Chloracidobacterium sp.]|nr:protein kinase [Chloracidobacterium sp.]
MVPRTISHYRILDKLGSGGMGEVYLAEDARLGRKLALKILPAEFTQAPDRVARFELEARAASALNHPNIITIYEVGEHEGAHFIATEFIEGRTLRQVLAPGGMPLNEALEIAIQTAGALQAAHEAGITHRDIKPENVMIRPDGYVKVLDFGLAKLTEKSGPKIAPADPGKVDKEAATIFRPVTDPGTVIGTVTYMSPEQARGLRVDARSDIFSLGVMLYEMIAGRPPFDGATSIDVISAILVREPTPISRLVAGIPSECEWSLNKALRKDREDRYDTVRSFLSDLKLLKSRLNFEAELARAGQPAPLFEMTSGTPISEAVTTELSGVVDDLISSPARRSSGKAIDSLAILPLINDGDDAEMEYLGDGITESIINSLTQLPQLRVIPRSTVFRYKGQITSPEEIGRELGVRAVLTGRILQHGDSLIVKTELVDVGRQTQLWGEQYRRSFTDIFSLQDDISREISGKLRLQLSGEERRKLVKHHTDNTEAWLLYQKGRYYVHKRTPDWIKKGVECFLQATDLDPNYALAYAGLAEAYGFLASSTGGQPPREAYPKAKAAAMKALELDKTLGEAHCTLGFFRLLYDWNLAAAEEEFRRAIELSPNFANAWDGCGFYLKATGQSEASIRASQRAQELEPLSLFITLSLAWAYYFAREYDRAIEQGAKALDMDPNFGFAYWHRGMAYIQQNRFGDAVNALRKAISLSGPATTFISYLGYAKARLGKGREARQMIAQLERVSKRQYVSSYFIAIIYLGLGDLDQTFEWLDKAYQERSGFMAFINVEPMLDGLRGDPRFDSLREKITPLA